jgi:hypothetical protein
MAQGRKTGGRKKGSRNRATAEARAAAAATGMMPLDYMLAVMRDGSADVKRRDAMAATAAPYLHSKLSPVEAKPANNPDGVPTSQIEVRFVPPPKWPDDELPDLP